MAETVAQLRERLKAERMQVESAMPKARWEDWAVCGMAAMISCAILWSLFG